MDFKTWWYDAKSTKWQILIGTILILFIFVGCFTFLETYEFEEWEYSGFIKSMIGILMGTVALGAITGIMIIFQEIATMSREKNQKIFDERLELYKDFTKQTMEVVKDGKLDDEERDKLKIIEKQIQMIASNETYKAWFTLYEDVLQLQAEEAERNYEEFLKAGGDPESDKGKELIQAIAEEVDAEDRKELLQTIDNKCSDFINSCRKDLEIGFVDKKFIEETKAKNKKQLARVIDNDKSNLFSVSNFGNYAEWLKQRLETDPKITEDQKKIHKNIYDYVKKEFGEEVSFFYRNHSVSIKYNGKKFCNISLRAPGNYGVYLTLLRAKTNEYNFPSISGLGATNFRNIASTTASNPKKGSEYYNIVNVKILNEDIKTQIHLSFEMRAKNTPLLKGNHAQINNILGLEN